MSREPRHHPDASHAWHELPAEKVSELLATDLRAGLAATEVDRRQKNFGPNRLTFRKGRSDWMRFLLQFHQPLLYVLLAASVITAVLGEWVDASVIFGVVFLNAVVGYVQEARAEKAISALAQMVVTAATVRRDGRRQRVPSETLVPGDMVLLESGDKVPADLRLSEVRDLQVDESALTGESVPVAKHGNVLALDTILAERHNLAFAGTLVTYGRAEGVVWATGDRTEMGRIAWLISEATDLSTPLTRKIAHFSGIMLWAILALAVATFALGLWRGESAFAMFMAAVALAVGAIPEGLPAAVTITLAIGVSRMARRRAIIRKLPAVETLGSTTVVCSDKTGTLTENQMTVQAVFAGASIYTVTGGGYAPQGEFRDAAGQRIDPSRCAALMECLRAGLLCNDAQLVHARERWTVQGDPTEGALIVVAEKAGLAHAAAVEALPRLDAIPFESEHQYMATLHDVGERGHVIYMKGAVERLLDRCTDALDESGAAAEIDRDSLRRTADELAARGLRVLAFARHLAPREQRRLAHRHVAGGLTFLGLQGMIDPPRAEATAAVRQCQQAGIAVKMITGDHLLTAEAIARSIGLEGAASRFAVSGRDLERLNDEQLAEVATEAAVFARVAPEQKLRLVRALQSRDNVVAMTGDGVNDAPALKQADIGVAMGITGTDVAKGAADMILTDDNFASIEAAVEEGRNVFDNLTKFIVWTLPTNLGEGLVILAAIVAGVALPALPVQILWINMMTALLLGLTLVFEPKERNLMLRPPRDPKRPILTFALFMRTGFVSLILLAGAFGLFMWEQTRGATLAEARTIVVNTIVVVDIFYLFNCRSLRGSTWSVGFFSNPWVLWGSAAMLAAQLALTYVPIMNRLFHTAPITAEAWLHILGVGLAAYAAVGMEKWIRARVAQRRSQV
ncbi:MAG: cation-transporting P-type ATPase [Betaproteobacteria bacterium]|nr:cation-transporting P-type ATPase [Betaproteobacteria bacterium]